LTRSEYIKLVDQRPSSLSPSLQNQDRPGLEESQDNMKQYFIDCVRDNLHLILCMSPLNPKFPVRARKFPGLIRYASVSAIEGTMQ
jgi:hypothetical protein